MLRQGQERTHRDRQRHSARHPRGRSIRGQIGYIAGYSATVAVGQTNNQAGIRPCPQSIDNGKGLARQGMIGINDRNVADHPIHNGGIVCGWVRQTRCSIPRTSDRS